MRLDKYLKVSRLIKRRTVANEVADAGRILINGKIAKASQAVNAGDIIEVTFGNRPIKVRVLSDVEPRTKDVAREMYEITLGRNPTYSLAPLGFIGAPTGIDVRLVADKSILPLINTGIAHKDAGVGQIGAGLVSPPIECFASALAALADQFVSAK